jgi:plasmid stability protein
MAILQVKGIDDQLYAALRQRASRDDRSISQEVVRIIREFLAQPPEALNATDEFLKLAGSWSDARPADEIVAEIRGARRSGRRFAGKVSGCA